MAQASLPPFLRWGSSAPRPTVKARQPRGFISSSAGCWLMPLSTPSQLKLAAQLIERPARPAFAGLGWVADSSGRGAMGLVEPVEASHERSGLVSGDWQLSRKAAHLD